MTRPDRRDWNAAPAQDIDYLRACRSAVRPDLRVAVCLASPQAPVDPEVSAAVRRAAEALRPLCSRIDDVEPDWLNVRSAFEDYFVAGLTHALRGLDQHARAMLDPGLRELLDAGEGISRERFLAAYDEQIRIGRESRLFHRDWDLLLTPTVAIAPFTAGRTVPTEGSFAHWLDWTPFTYPFNFTGQPALTMPCGFTLDGLPIGVQLAGDAFDEGPLLAVAAHLERELSVSMPMRWCAAREGSA